MTKAPPDNNPKTLFGIAKPGLAMVPPVGLLEVGMVMQDGAAKYGPFNWRDYEVTFSTYYNAAMRHLMCAWDSGDVDADSGRKHLAHAAACCLILLDAAAQGTLLDDRPTPGGTEDFIKDNTKDLNNGKQA